MELSEEERRELLRLARSSIECTLKGLPLPSIGTHSKALDEPSAAFVTLKSNGELRGCIGYIEPRFPLTQTVQEVALKSAFEDPRFAPLTSEELEQTEIEISVLSPLKKVADVNEIEAGRDGVVIDAGFTRGLLLPQVASEFNWDREQFLQHAALKAGLHPDSWQKPGVQIFSFTTERFSEADISSKV